MKIKFLVPNHVLDKEYLAKHKKFLLRLITKWNRLQQPAFYLVKAKPKHRRLGAVWYSFTFSRSRRTFVHISVYRDRALNRITEQQFEVIK